MSSTVRLMFTSRVLDRLRVVLGSAYSMKPERTTDVMERRPKVVAKTKRQTETIITAVIFKDTTISARVAMVLSFQLPLKIY